MKKYFRKILFFLSLSLLILAFIYHELLAYLWMQGKGQFSILYHAQSIEKVLAKEELDENTRKKLLLIAKIKQFAVEEIGLTPSNSYTDFYDQEGKALLWVLSACPPYSLEEYQWSFPIVGSVGYKGFFEKEKGLLEQQELIKMGLDTDLGEVSAWSTLGWFNDPVFSNMVQRSEGELARLIIHEMTHGTIYIKSDAVLNENLASYIGDEGAYLFLEKEFGKESKEYRYYSQRMEDLELYREAVKRSTAELKNTYENIRNLSDSAKANAKQQVLKKIKGDLAQLNFHQKERFKRIRSSDFQPNNTFFTGSSMYNSLQDSLRQLHLKKCNGDYRKLIDYYREMED